MEIYHRIEKVMNTCDHIKSQHCYQDVTYFICWPMFVTSNYLNRIKSSYKVIYTEEFDDTQKVVLDRIIETCSFLFLKWKYGIISATDVSTMSYYIMMLLSSPLRLHREKNSDRQMLRTEEPAVKSAYTISMESNKKYYWGPLKNKQVVNLSIWTTVYTCKYVFVVKDVVYTPGFFQKKWGKK